MSFSTSCHRLTSPCVINHEFSKCLNSNMHYDAENKIEKTGRGRKSHQGGKSATLASLHISLPHSLSSVCDPGRAQPGRSRAVPHACDGSGASPQARTVPAAFIFVILDLFSEQPLPRAERRALQWRGQGGSAFAGAALAVGAAPQLLRARRAGAAVALGPHRRGDTTSEKRNKKV